MHMPSELQYGRDIESLAVPMTMNHDAMPRIKAARGNSASKTLLHKMPLNREDGVRNEEFNQKDKSLFFAPRWHESKYPRATRACGDFYSKN